MTHDFERTHLWKSTLAKRVEADEHEIARDRLRGAYLKFRDRVSHLVSTIKSELPGLTVHDITHLDALWRVASEIAGPTYELTPAEAFVLGGAILLHDSAHAIAAYPGGKAEIKQTQHWRDLIALRQLNDVRLFQQGLLIFHLLLQRFHRLGQGLDLLA